MNEKHFIAEIHSKPCDPTPRLVFADWLEEKGDPRSELVRLDQALRKLETPDREQLEARMLELVKVRKTTLNWPLLSNSLGMSFTLIFPGEFVMGSPYFEDDRTQREHQAITHVTRPFYCGIHQVTQRQYKSIMGDNPSYFSLMGEGKDLISGVDSAQLPVESVSCQQAKVFCDKLSELPEETKSGRRYRLLTEAEWEYACRAGTTTPFNVGNTLSNQDANVISGGYLGTTTEVDDLQRPTEVGSYSANLWGLFDMHGNVSEWCKDGYREKLPGGENPEVGFSSELQMTRGGSWGVRAQSCRSGKRVPVSPSSTFNYLGFRICFTIA